LWVQINLNQYNYGLYVVGIDIMASPESRGADADSTGNNYTGGKALKLNSMRNGK
jgi:hypothetical protein